MKYVVWTLLVWGAVIVLVSLEYATSTCQDSEFGCIGPTPGDIAGFLVGIGFVLYLIGLGVMSLWDRMGRKS